jgi:hypothetical protein
LESLALDLAINGQKVPITVRMEGDVAFVSDGCRRFKAAEVANRKYSGKIKTLRCVTENKGIDEKTRIFNQISFNSGKPFETWEIGEACKRLHETHKIPIRDIAQRIGKTDQTVLDYIELANSPEEIRRLMREKKIKPTTARKMAKASPEKRATAGLKADLGGKVTGKDVEEEKPFSAAAFAKGLEKFGFKKVSENKHATFNISVRIDQKDPAFVGMWIL